jgi:hypothetical protein
MALHQLDPGGRLDPGGAEDRHLDPVRRGERGALHGNLGAGLGAVPVQRYYGCSSASAGAAGAVGSGSWKLITSRPA